MQLLKAVRRKDYWHFAVVDVAPKTPGMHYEYLGRQTPCERFIRKPLCGERSVSYVNSYAERGIVIGEHHSLRAGMYD